MWSSLGLAILPPQGQQDPENVNEALRRQMSQSKRIALWIIQKVEHEYPLFDFVPSLRALLMTFQITSIHRLK